MITSYLTWGDVPRAGRVKGQRRIAVSVTLDPDLVMWLDKRVAANEFRNRSDAVESLLETVRKEGAA